MHIKRNRWTPGFSKLLTGETLSAISGSAITVALPGCCSVGTSGRYRRRLQMIPTMNDPYCAIRQHAQARRADHEDRT